MDLRTTFTFPLFLCINCSSDLKFHYIFRVMFMNIRKVIIRMHGRMNPLIVSTWSMSGWTLMEEIDKFQRAPLGWFWKWRKVNYFTIAGFEWLFDAYKSMLINLWIIFEIANLLLFLLFEVGVQSISSMTWVGYDGVLQPETQLLCLVSQADVGLGISLEAGCLATHQNRE